MAGTWSASSTAPPVDRMPVVSMASFTVMGKPCNGPRSSPRATARVSLGARRTSALGVERDDGVDVAIEPVDAFEEEVEELDRCDFTATDSSGELSRGVGGVHAQRLAHLRSSTTS